MTDDPNRTAGRGARDETAEAGRRLADDAKSSAQSAMSQATDYADRKVHDARDGMANEVSDVASALRKAAESTRGGSLQEQAFQALAGTLADASDSLMNKEPGDLLADVGGFARRNPLAFLGVAALAGFAASRVAGATANRHPSDYPDYDTGYDRTDDRPMRRSVAEPASAPAVHTRSAGMTPGSPGSASTVGTSGGTSAVPGERSSTGIPGSAGSTGVASGSSGGVGTAGTTPGTYDTKPKGAL